MKRTFTKRMIRRAEELVAVDVADCLTSWHQRSEDWREERVWYLGLWLTSLLSYHLELDNSWSRDRWVDGIEDISVLIDGPTRLTLSGSLWWGLSSDIGGEQTAEPFVGNIFLTGNKRHPIAYDLSFGEADERRTLRRRPSDYSLSQL